MTQRDELRQHFQERPYQWIPLYEILRMGIAQYNARILELRREGMKIENKWMMKQCKKHSWFRFVPEGETQLNLFQLDKTKRI